MIDTIKEIAAWLVSGLFLLIISSLIVWILRLHFDPRFVNFDLTKLIEKQDGAADGEKIRMWSAYLSGLYAFFHLLVRDHAAFLTFGPWFLGIALAHLVANRVTAKDPVSPTPMTTTTTVTTP